MSSAIGLKTCAIAAGIKEYKSTITKKKKKHDKTVLLVKSKFNKIEVLISKTLIDSVISHDEFVVFAVTNIDVVMHIYNLMEHRDIYSKTSGRLWQYYRDQPTLKVTSTTKLLS